MWTGAAISAGGSIAGGLIGAGGAKKAAKAQEKATQAALDEQRRQYDTGRSDLEPWRDIGGQAIDRLGVLMGIAPSETRASNFDNAAYLAANPDIAEYRQFRESPYRHYQDYGKAEGREATWLTEPTNNAAADPEFGALNKKFTLADFWDDPVTKASYHQGLDQGTKALANMAGARGNRNSGAQLKALTRFSTDYTGNQAGQSYDRFYGDQDRIFNRLSGISGTGQTATTNTAQMGQQNANTVSGLLTAQGNARGAAAIARSNALGGALTSAGNTIGNMINSSKYANPYGGKTSDWSDGFVWKKGGLLVGPKHEEGGIEIEAEGGEFIIPADVVKKKGVRYFRDLLAKERYH